MKNTKSFWSVVAFSTAAVLAITVGIALYWSDTVYLIDGPENGFLLTKTPLVRYSIYLPAFYVHILTGSLVMMTGIFQLSTKLRVRYPRWHRLSGKIYLATLLVLTAPSGFIMACYANGGLFAKTGFVLLATAWWLTTWKGFQFALRKQWNDHRRFMLRSYALTFAAVTLRLYLSGFAIAGYQSDFIYAVVAWLCWIPNLLAAEWWIARSTTRDEVQMHV